MLQLYSTVIIYKMAWFPFEAHGKIYACVVKGDYSISPWFFAVDCWLPWICCQHTCLYGPLPLTRSRLRRSFQRSSNSCSTCKCACRSSSHSVDTERNSTRRTYTRSALHVVPHVCCSPAHSTAGCSRPAQLRFCYTCGPWSPSRPIVGPPSSNLAICWGILTPLWR